MVSQSVGASDGALGSSLESSVKQTLTSAWYISDFGNLPKSQIRVGISGAHEI